jgi:hypothetical protein
MQEAYSLQRRVRLRPLSKTQPLEEINTVFDRLRRGDVQGRVVVKMAERAGGVAGGVLRAPSEPRDEGFNARVRMWSTIEVAWMFA